MPKILINEKDRTSPGAPGGYANYSVLITGFAGRYPVLKADKSQNQEVKADAVLPDTNGVYEFTSADDFKNVIGLVSPKLVARKYSNTSNTYEAEWSGYHYGNQMAYELLRLGYSVIYKPIAVILFEEVSDTDPSNNATKTNLISEVNKYKLFELDDTGALINGDEVLVDEDKNPIIDADGTQLTAYKIFTDAAASITTEEYWEIFKDKASYDFRFVTHGLLESNDLTNFLARYKVVEEAKKILDIIQSEIKALYIENKWPTEEIQEVDVANAIYSGTYNNENTITLSRPDGSIIKAIELKTNYRNEYAGFKPIKSSTAYLTFEEANEGVAAELKELETYLNGADGYVTATINKANTVIANLAKYKATGDIDSNGDASNDLYAKEIAGRGDCIALIELDEHLYVNTNSTTRPEAMIIDAINDMGSIDAANGKFCAMTVPSVIYNMTDYDKIGEGEDAPRLFDNNKKFPGSFHYLACFINSLNLGFAEWYAAAGYTRGVSSYMVDYTTVKLGEIAINALEPRNYDDPQKDYPKFACNVIANFRGSYYLWGNRTAHPLGKKGSLDTGDLVASHFLNIRQLCITIKKQLYVACRRFTFDPNSDTLWFNFVNSIKPTLEIMKANQGIRDYKIIKVTTDKKAVLKAKVRIIPIEAVEDFDLEVSLEDSFGETTAVVTE